MDEKLPDGWALAKIGDITDVIGGSTPSRTEKRYFGGDIIWVTPTEIPKKTVSYITTSKEKLTVEGFNASGVRWIPKGSILLTSRASIGYIAIAGTPLTTNQGFASFILPDGIDPNYFGWWLRSQKDNLEDLSGGTTFKEISKAILKEISAPIAPTNEQRRIVAVIEQQFTRLDNAVASLQSAKARVKQYRASLLKSAVEGELTKEWRVEHPVEETSEQLLKRILAERRKRWEEAELAKMKEKPKDDKWKQKYKEPQEPDLEKLSVLPEGWCWATVEQIADVGTGATPLRSRGEYYNGGTIPWITSGSVNREFIVSAEEFITEKALAETNAKVFPIGSLILAMYGEGKTRGKISELKMEAATNQACAAIVFRPFSFLCQPYIKYFFMSNYLAIRSFAVGGVQPNLNLAVVKETIIPLPPLSEQIQIVAEVEAKLSNIEQLEATIEADLKRAEHERQSILQEAFAGRLVLQDMNDEPASVLLERIREERKKREEAEKIVKASRKGDHVGSAKRPRVGKIANGQRNAGLYKKLVEVGQPLAPDDLFNRVGLRSDAQPESVEEFYEELHADVVAGLIMEELPRTDKVLLYAVEQDNEDLEEVVVLKENDTVPVVEEMPTIREEVSRRSLWDE